MRYQITVTLGLGLALGLLAAACQQPAGEARYPSPPPPSQQVSSPGYTSSAQACTDYGFTPGTPSFDSCVSRERAARSTGRVNRDYAEARLAGDARAACTSYGLSQSSPRYQTCVNREIDARRYQGNQAGPGYRVDQSGNRVDGQGYRVDAYGNRLLPGQG
jgi:hypothetical protein